MSIITAVYIERAKALSHILSDKVDRYWELYFKINLGVHSSKTSNQLYYIVSLFHLLLESSFCDRYIVALIQNLIYLHFIITRSALSHFPLLCSYCSDCCTALLYIALSNSLCPLLMDINCNEKHLLPPPTCARSDIVQSHSISTLASSHWSAVLSAHFSLVSCSPCSLLIGQRKLTLPPVYPV